jgi:hypothetical protein
MPPVLSSSTAGGCTAPESTGALLANAAMLTISASLEPDFPGWYVSGVPAPPEVILPAR